MKVLITTSGLGQRLGDLTKYTNKSLVRVGKKPALSYIVEQYPEDVELVITLGHFKHQVHDFLETAYPNRKFTFVVVDNYDGPGSSLAYSILQAKKHIDCPFIFHACDTLVFEDIPAPDKNWLGGFKKKFNNSQYVSFDIQGDKVVQLRQKGEFSRDFNYIGLAGIYNHELFFQTLENSYLAAPDNNQLSDCNAIEQMLDVVNFEYKAYSNWLDIGNIDGLQHARDNIYDKFDILDKLDESIFLFDDFVIKFFSNQTTCLNRIQRAELLGDLVPELETKAANFYRYKYVPGHVLSHNLSEFTFKEFLDWAKNKLWKKQITEDKFYYTCYNFYFTKTFERMNKFLTQSGIKDISCVINGISVPSITDMLLKIDPDWLCKVEPYQFHGDFILENIIANEDGFTAIDWRQDFGGDLVNGDIYYDLAKLNHNLIFNHDIVNKNLFNIEINEEIKCDILRSNNLIECQKIFNNFLVTNGFDVKKVNVLSAIIWINMAPLHHHPLNNFLFFFGKLNLFKALNAGT